MTPPSSKMVPLRCLLFLVASYFCHLGGTAAGDDKLMTRDSGIWNETSERSGSVAFTAVKTNNQRLGYKQAVKFEKVLLNEGYGYRAHNGIFCAPRTGVYVFTSSLLHQGEGITVHFAIVHEGRLMAGFHANAEWEQFSQTVIIRVRRGETVSVRNLRGNNPTIYGDEFSTFSGYLLK
ncbi:cerebellin-3-like [Mya arenaria]|uniref:cerebellin-3-like n=1 Tax=Mya arenaria TaxID=6604 RepID=UPI0022E2772F|nr:cerebellin-3-like [Mya arenaria]